MRIAVGCPISNRAWIFPEWLKHVEKAFADFDEPELVFVYGTSRDNTKELLPQGARVVEIEEPEESGADREWGWKRYQHMVEIRNSLLRAVREMTPDFFLSVDSDILLNPGLLPNLLETIENFDAVGGKVYLTRPPERGSPNWAKFRSYDGGIIRHDTTGVFKTHAIMALKLMSPAAYNVDYKMNWHGEDLGWSKNCNEHGLKLAFDGRIASKHVMSPYWLDRVDERIGW